MRGDRTPGPSPVNICKGLNGCGRDVLPTPLGVAEHRAYHLERSAGRPTAGITIDAQAARLDAWREYAHQLERLADDLRGQIATRDDAIEGLTADYATLLAEFNTLRSEATQ